jgi:hypothetical protein
MCGYFIYGVSMDAEAEIDGDFVSTFKMGQRIDHAPYLKWQEISSTIQNYNDFVALFLLGRVLHSGVGRSIVAGPT